LYAGIGSRIHPSCRLNPHAISQAKVVQNLFDVRLEALGNAGFHGDGELDPDLELGAAKEDLQKFAERERFPVQLPMLVVGGASTTPCDTA